MEEFSEEMKIQLMLIPADYHLLQEALIIVEEFFHVTIIAIMQEVPEQ